MQQSPDQMTIAVPLDEDVVLFEAPTGKYLRSLTGPARWWRWTVTATHAEEPGLILTALRESFSVKVWFRRADLKPCA